MLRRHLTPAQKARVDGTLSKKGGEDEQLAASVEGVPFFRKDARTLCPRVWLTDEVVNRFMVLLKDRHNDLVQLRDGFNATAAAGGQEQRPRIRPAHAFSSFFWAKLNQDAHGNTAANTYTFNNVRRWDSDVDIFECSVVIIPINISHSHWRIGAIYPQRQRIAIVDSLDDSSLRVQHDREYKWLLRYVQDVHSIKRGTLLPETWQNLAVQSPKQTNGYDCGVFALLAADFLMLGEPLTYSQKDIPQARRWIALQCLECSLSWHWQ
jgi:sentrin-specific protease 1